ncbi:copper amine oxidase N-terminal domain-containing protein [Paenibacillus naphthalenovorans]|uniref:Copper amine oxidase n=1 Tax=Paenibacillus naphthalenovorans TaxID=162209 RepID=A0A0U2UDZ1_9BACL|nr:copper amine oxidase N-terminal domain-containing protein [Paenibacillus naphthalenovorans]ALS24425.1 copper amine oxidase [Paenibacillus naphthalenovorans]SDJ14360.1 Copper amine oxidase N-terminal domain-containing protein [Paenibacillus naphthalenovorans]
MKRQRLLAILGLTAALVAGSLGTSGAAAQASDYEQRYEADKAEAEKYYDVVYKVANADKDALVAQVTADMESLAELLNNDYQELKKKYPPGPANGLIHNQYQRSIDPGNTLGSFGRYYESYKRIRDRYSNDVKSGAYPKSLIDDYKDELKPDSRTGGAMKRYAANKADDDVREKELESIRQTRENTYKQILEERNRAVQEILEDRQKLITDVMNYRQRIFDEAPIAVKPLTVSFAEIKVMIDGELQTFEQPPVNDSGNVLVPMRAIFEALGATVLWNQEQRAVQAKKGGTTIDLKLGSKDALINGSPKTLDAPAKLVGSSTMVPIRFISEALGAKVEWDQLTQTVLIETK